MTEEGYITLNGTTPTYHYFLKDHLGNVRVVMNQNGSTVEQSNNYYPFGGIFDSTGNSEQPYKFGGKEYDPMHGLNWCDFEARMKDDWFLPTIDPLCENFYSTSPYVYCLNNPLKYIDPTGCDTVSVNNINWSEFDSKQDVIQLNEISIQAASPWVVTERGGVYISYNVFTNKYGRIIGEKGLQNTDWILFDIFMAGRLSKAKAASASISSVAMSRATQKFSQSAINRGVNYVMRNPSKISHIFGQSRHNLTVLVTKLGGQEKTVRTVLNTLNSSGSLPASGLFNSTINIGGINVTVRGIVQNSFPKIGTIFVQ